MVVRIEAGEAKLHGDSIETESPGFWDRDWSCREHETWQRDAVPEGRPTVWGRRESNTRSVGVFLADRYLSR
jgi:hypothetical protein